MLEQERRSSVECPALAGTARRHHHVRDYPTDVALPLTPAKNAEGGVDRGGVGAYRAAFGPGTVLVASLKGRSIGGATAGHVPAWITHDRPGSITIAAGADIIWVEGTAIIRKELTRWLDASMWVQGDLDDQERRLLARDGESPEQLEHVANWLLEELPFLLREQPWARVTMVVAGSPQIDHDPDTELVIASPTIS